MPRPRAQSFTRVADEATGPAGAPAPPVPRLLFRLRGADELRRPSDGPHRSSRAAVSRPRFGEARSEAARCCRSASSRTAKRYRVAPSRVDEGARAAVTARLPSSSVVRRHDGDLRKACRDCAQPQHRLLDCDGVLPDHPARKPRARFALDKALELPDEIADERIAGAGGEADEYHHGTRRMSGRGNDHDRAVAIQITRSIEAQVWAAVERIVLKYRSVDAAGGRGGKAVIVDEPTLRRRHEHGHAGEVGYAADVVPVAVGQQDVPQALAIVPCGVELVGGRP